MLGPNSFHVDVGYDDAGLLVTVSHLPTNQRRSGRPNDGESCAKLQARLHAELIDTFLKLADFRFEVGRCEVNGMIGGFYRVEHLPSKRAKTVDNISSPQLKNHQQAVLELLLEDLLRGGILKIKKDEQTHGLVQ